MYHAYIYQEKNKQDKQQFLHVYFIFPLLLKIKGHHQLFTFHKQWYLVCKRYNMYNYSLPRS